MLEVDPFLCPKCQAPCDRDEIDIGVGVQCGPWNCTECSWSESYPIVDMIPSEDTDDIPW